MNMLISAMPARVRDRVSLLPEGHQDALLADVDAETASLLHADRHTLTRYRGESRL